MPKIAAYHPVVKVKMEFYEGPPQFIEVDMDDWYDKNEIIEALGKSTGALTGGELLHAVSRGAIKQGFGVLDARIVGSGYEPTVSIKSDDHINQIRF